MNEIKEIKYGGTNCFVICGSRGSVLFDTGWAGTYFKFCRALKNSGVALSSITFLLISHYHPDHMGIAQEISSAGVPLLVMDVQKAYLHAADSVFAKDKSVRFHPIADADVVTIQCGQSRDILSDMGIDGEVIHTPGHSGDSVSLVLDDGTAFVGDLCPLFTVPAYGDKTLENSWNELLSHGITRIFYGHSNTQQISGIHSVGDIPAEYAPGR
jgi:glyoxylase-like metal-dependent hydrolase (beta-lactamase superfamily II)